jgi:hypothetical protein
MRMRITLRVDIDPEALRKDAQIMAPDATAADIGCGATAHTTRTADLRNRSGRVCQRLPAGSRRRCSPR